MKLLNRVGNFCRRKSNKKLEDARSSLLVLIGVLSFLVASYIGFFLGEVIPASVRKLNAGVFSLAAFSLLLTLGIVGLFFWYFTCVASRCHNLLYERWFK